VVRPVPDVFGVFGGDGGGGDNDFPKTALTVAVATAPIMRREMMWNAFMLAGTSIDGYAHFANFLRVAGI
jgi:hypothetical protein